MGELPQEIRTAIFALESAVFDAAACRHQLDQAEIRQHEARSKLMGLIQEGGT